MSKLDAMLDTRVKHNGVTYELYAKEMFENIPHLSSVDILFSFNPMWSSVMKHSLSKYEHFVLKYWECKLPNGKHFYHFGTF